MPFFSANDAALLSSHMPRSRLRASCIVQSEPHPALLTASGTRATRLVARGSWLKANTSRRPDAVGGSVTNVTNLRCRLSEGTARQHV